jgi:hypothetical protein
MEDTAGCGMGDPEEIQGNTWNVVRNQEWESKGGRKYREIRDGKSMAATRRGIHGDLGEI